MKEVGKEEEKERKTNEGGTHAERAGMQSGSARSTSRRGMAEEAEELLPDGNRAADGDATEQAGGRQDCFFRDIFP